MASDHLNSGGIPINLNASSPLPECNASYLANDQPNLVQTLDDLALCHITLDKFPYVKAWREKLFDPQWKPEICDELPRLLTEYLRTPAAKKQSPQTRRAASLRYVFSNKKPLVGREDLLPGQTTTSFVGPVVYPDTIGYCIWPELKTVSQRAQNSFNIRAEVADRLNRDIFPYWLERRTVQEVARYNYYNSEAFPNRDSVNEGNSIDPVLVKKAGETPKCQELFERVAFFLSDKATCVSHTVPDFGRMLKYGLQALLEQMDQDIQNHRARDEKVTFLEGVMEVFKGAMTYAGHLAEEAEQCGNLELARICRKVPAKPAETLQEALTAIWICYHLLLQENTNFGLSMGRMDQLLNAYYLSDWKKAGGSAARAAYTEKAVEYMCHFFLRCSDHVPLSTEGSETLFAGSGSNQALTVGGVRYEKGALVDAVCDMTYIILKATELLSIRDPNVHARYHKEIHHRDATGKPLPPEGMCAYLKRICQVNIVTRATPAIHGDVPVIEAMSSYYVQHQCVGREEALADAADYASIGCIEQNSAGKHYGNTGSTLLVLPAVLELTIFGGKHRSSGVDENAPNLMHNRKQYTSTPLWKMNSMDQFIDAFQFQLDAMAREAVRCNNYLGRSLEKVRPSPFLSGLFTGPTNEPGHKNACFRDVASGGAKYNSAGVAIIGLADVIDAFCIMDRLVFSGKITAHELIDAMNANFDVSEIEDGKFWENLADHIRNLFRKGADLPPQRMKEIIEAIRLTQKFGAGVDEDPESPAFNGVAVKYTKELTHIIDDTFHKYRTHRGGRYLAGYWSMTNHAGFGMLTKATPNGRKNGESFASGITPSPGIVKPDGQPVILLDHMLSVAQVEAPTVRNGYTYNLSLTTRGPNHFDEDTALMGGYMKTFEDQDGMLVQLCVSKIQDLEAAHKAATDLSQNTTDPQAQAVLAPYKDMMIRVAGYSAYFVTLSPEMRIEIINRANFALKNGREQHGLVSI